MATDPALCGGGRNGGYLKCAGMSRSPHSVNQNKGVTMLTTAAVGLDRYGRSWELTIISYAIVSWDIMGT